MKQLAFTIEIAAPKQAVWNILWNDTTYRKWTAAFSEGSHAVTPDWNEGTRVHFLGGDGQGGMYSDILKSEAPNVITFRHLGVISNGKEEPFTDESQEWNGAHEEYYLNESNGKTTLDVKLQSIDSFADYFQEAFPKALEIVKELAEAN